MKRSKLYYPKSSITENLVTNGTRYMLENGTAYAGEYHRYDTGEVFTGAEWNPSTSMKLFPISSTKNHPAFSSGPPGRLIRSINSDMNVKKYSNPSSQISVPSASDFETGFYFRYFCSKRNEPVLIYEISRDAYTRFGKLGGINEFLYKRGKIKWTLTGDEFDIYDQDGRFISAGVLNQNRREVFALQSDFPYIQTLFGDYRQFTEYSRTNLNRLPKITPEEDFEI